MSAKKKSQTEAIGDRTQKENGSPDVSNADLPILNKEKSKKKKKKANSNTGEEADKKENHSDDTKTAKKKKNKANSVEDKKEFFAGKGERLAAMAYGTGKKLAFEVAVGVISNEVSDGVHETLKTVFSAGDSYEENKKRDGER